MKGNGGRLLDKQEKNKENKEKSEKKFISLLSYR